MGEQVFLRSGKIKKPAQIVRQQSVGIRPHDAELASNNRGKRTVENSCRHPCAASGYQHVTLAKLATGYTRLVDPHEIGFVGANFAILRNIPDTDELMSAVRIVPRSVGTTKRDAELHGGDLAQFDLRWFHRETSLMLGVANGRLVTGRNGILGADFTIFTHGRDFSATLVAEVFAGGLVCLPLRVVQARCLVGIVPLIHPLPVRAAVYGPILRLTHMRYR